MDPWVCAGCGGLWAPGAPCCPACRSKEYEEDGVAKSTVTSGSSHEPGHEPDGWPVPGETAPEPEAAEVSTVDTSATPEPEVPAEAETEPDVPSPPPASAVKAEHVDYAAEVLGVPAEEAESMTKPELVELAKKAGPTLTSPDGG